MIFPFHGLSTVSGAKVPTESCGPTQRGPAGQSAGLRSPRRTCRQRKKYVKRCEFLKLEQYWKTWKNMEKPDL
jgi:hypothetical protein